MSPAEESGKHKRLIAGLTLAGLLLGLWLAVMQGGRINRDATLYLEMAQRFADGDSQGALSLYNWPLFPWLMAQAHHLTGLSVENAARLLTTIWFGITTWGFLTLIHEAGGRRHALLAGALLLFSAPYIVGDVLPMIMRDQGYWAFYLLSLLFFLRFYRDQRTGDALLWQTCAVLATLFRVEAVSFIVLLPLALLLRQDQPWRRRLRNLGIAYCMPVAAALLVAAGAMFLPMAEIQQKLGRLTEMQSALMGAYHQVSSGLSAKAHIYGEMVLGSFMAEYAMRGLLLTLLAVLASNILGASGWLAVALAASGKRCQAPALATDARSVLLWAAGIHLLNLFVILLTVFLLSGRYVVGLSFIILIFAAFNLAGLYQGWRDDRARGYRPRTAWFLFAATVITLYLVDNLAQRDPTRNYEQAAVAWVKQHSANNARIYYDSARLRYYARAPWAGRDDGWEKDLAGFARDPVQFDYLVLNIKHKHTEKLSLLLQLQHYRKVQEFKARNGDLILIMAAPALPADGAKPPP